jgi:hypothetical protein
MKWVYVPTMFVLAFFYAKVTLNDFMPRKQNWAIDRSPANGPQTCREMLSDFYPSQTPEFLETRINANEDFYSFFRAFSPVFYKQMLEQNFGSLFKPLEKYRGTIAGDLHVENFGFAIDDKGKVLFVVNDFDDATEGEIYHDVIRHFISAKIVDKKITWDDYFSAYQKGLKGESHHYSFYTEKGMNEVAEVTEKYIDKYVSFDAPFKFKKFKTPYRASTSIEATELIKALKEKFPKIEIFDHYVRIKEDGGSAGLKRFQVLARVSPKDKVQWLDIKESAISGYDKVFGPQAKETFENRMVAIKKNIYGNKFDESIDVLTIDKHPYSFRLVDQFASGLKLADIPEDDYKDVILDEAYVIGRMHQLSLKDNAPEYARTWAEVKSSTLEERLMDLKFKLKDLYKESKKDLAVP